MARVNRQANDLSGGLLTDTESAAFSRRQHASEVLEGMVESDGNRDIAGWSLSQAILDPRGTLLVAATTTDTMRETLRAAAEKQANVPVDVQEVRIGRQEVVALRTELLRIWTVHQAAKSNGLGPIEHIEEATGAEILGLSLDAESQELVVAVDASVPGDFDLLATRAWGDLAASSVVIRSQVSLPVRVEQRSRPVLAAGRTSSPGQVRGGLAIEAPCSSSFSIRDSATGVRYLVTAGHCIDNGTGGPIGVSGVARHNGRTIGSGSWCRLPPGNGGACPAQAYTDIGLIQLAPGSLASEYTVSSLPTLPNDTPYQTPLTSFSSSTTTSSSIWYCLEGASPFRPLAFAGSSLYSTSCAYGGAETSTGFGHVPVRGCSGDSGGLVRSGGSIRGLLISIEGTVLYTSPYGDGGCNAQINFTYAQRIMTRANTSVLLASVNSSATNPFPNLNTRAGVRNMYTNPTGSALCISAENSSWANGARYLQWGCIAGHSAQQFGFVPIASASSPGYGTDVYRLVRYDGSSRGCLSLNRQPGNGNGMADGTEVINWGCVPNYDGAQLWRLQWTSAPGYAQPQFQVVSLWSNKCLSVPNSSNQDGLWLITWGCILNHPAQAWRLT